MKKKPAGIGWHKIILNFAVLLIFGSCIMPADLTELIKDEAFKTLVTGGGGIKLIYEHPKDQSPELSSPGGTGTVDNPVLLNSSNTSVIISVQNPENYENFQWFIGDVLIPSATNYNIQIQASTLSAAGFSPVVGVYQLNVAATFKADGIVYSTDIYIKVVN